MIGDVQELTKDIDKRNWGWIVRYVGASLLTPALTCGLKRHGLLPLLDVELQGYFEGIYELSADRNRRLKAQAIDLIKCLNQADIEPVLLKGIAGMLDGLDQDEGERIMSDIDVLIGLGELPRAIKVLQEIGYRYYEEPSPYRLDMTYKHHAPALIADGLVASVELHIRPTSLAGRKTILSSEYALKGARCINVGGAQALIPSANFRLLHNFFHSQQDDKNYYFGRLHVRGLLDWVILYRSLESEVDWSAVVGRVKRFHLKGSFSAYLLNLKSCFNLNLSPGSKLISSAAIHSWRQRMLINSLAFTRINNMVLFMLLSGWHVFSPAYRRRTYGDISVLKAYKLHLDKLLSPDWRKDRIEDLRELL